MFKSIVSIFALALSLAFIVPTAHAADPADPHAEAVSGPLAQACQGDLQKYCSDITKGEGRDFACLKSHDDKLSPDCSTQWKQAKTQWKAKMQERHAACGSDVQKFCSNVGSPKDIGSCLDQHKSDLSASCKDYRSKSMSSTG